MPRITIVGGGVAGLTLAATLDPRRFEVTVVERNPGASRVPTAFGIWPEATAALERLGLADALKQRGHQLTSGTITADSGRRPVSVTLPGQNTWLITRPALLDLLDASVPASVCRVARQVTEVTSLEGDVVVAADGVRSRIRTQVWGDRPRDTGVVAIRGVVAAAPPDQMLEYWGERLLVGVGPNRLPQGLGTNWYVAARRPEEPAAEALAWARHAVARFPEPVRDALSRAVPELTVVNTIWESRRPRTLVKDRYVLVGDAAHAMSPNLGRGACEAMIDAIVLGEELNRYGLDGVRRYDRARLAAGQRTRVAAALVRRFALSPRLGRMAVMIAGVLGRR